jgi:hypothetical protein
MEQHVRVLGILNIVWGALGVLAGLIMLVVFGGVFGILGAVSHHEPNAAIAMPFVAMIGGAIALFLLIVSAPSVIAGIGLLYMKSWARVLGIVVSVLHLFNIPFGTALGIYGLWVLASQQGAEYFTSHQA